MIDNSLYSRIANLDYKGKHFITIIQNSTIPIMKV